MSLSRYENIESILNLNEPQYGSLYRGIDLSSVVHEKYIPNDSKIVQKRAEMHIYTFNGDYLASNHEAEYLIRDEYTNSFLVDIKKAFQDSGIINGSFLVTIGIFEDILGTPQSPGCRLVEISPEQDELRLQLVDQSKSIELANFKKVVEALQGANILNQLVVNFGKNRVRKILNIKFDDKNIYIKLYKPFIDDIFEKELCFFSIEYIDPYIDTVILASPVDGGEVTILQHPNFHLDVDEYVSNSTVYKSWNELLDADAPTTQRIIDSFLSGSATATLNVDYTDFNNFIFYSSAKERIDNFKYKLELFEGYQKTIATLNQSTASSTQWVIDSITINQKRIDVLKSTFDPFERWLYYHGTSSLFTHDRSGSLTPWPKYIENGKYVPHHTTSSIATTWYNKNIFSASAYDARNSNRLYWSIPEHVIMDENNSDYTLFVEMVAQHFDNIYMYVNALTQIHEKDEHPERGPSGELLYHIAKSFGWKLQNTRELSNLWQYKLGTDQSGSWSNTGSLQSTSRENQTYQVWKRIVNNLPYLLKTKGTGRSVKAMMSIYGIPNTLISIKEYGGPSVSQDKPSIIEDRYYYKLHFSGSQYIELPRRVVPTTSGSWQGVQRVSDSVIFRFNTNHSSSVSMSLWAIEDGTNRAVNSNLEVVHISNKQNGTSSYSGSNAYGYLRFKSTAKSGSVIVSSSVESAYYPFFDNDSWSVKIETTPSLNEHNTSGSVLIDFGKMSDCLYGRITHTGSLVWSSSFDVAEQWSAKSSSLSSSDYIVLGGTTGSNSNRFIGNIDGYKEYFTKIDKEIFHQHILNPAAYFTESPSGSYYNLHRYFPLGLDVQRWNHSTYTQVSSSHPNRNISFDTTASFYNFTGSQEVQYTSAVETFYVYVPTLGGNVLRGEKIRLEENKLRYDLSPDSRSELSQFDKSTTDTNRLAIVFAPSDHVNRDIYNHMGFDELDDWIADPEYEFLREYSELKRFGREYWQKYTQKNDINAFIRIFSVFDYTFFEQIKQLVPARANLITGILIEPNILERSKVKLTSLPSIETPSYEKEIKLYNLTQSGEYPVYETEIQKTGSFHIEDCYYTGSLQTTRSLYIQDCYYTSSLQSTHSVFMEDCGYSGSIKRFYSMSACSRHHFDATDICGCGLGDTINMIIIKFSGSQGETGSIIDKHLVYGHGTPKYYKVIEHYEAQGTFTSLYQKHWMTHVSMSYKKYYSRSLEPTNYQIEEDSSRNNSRFLGSKISSPDINIDSKDTVDGSPVVQVWEVNPNNIYISDEDVEGNLIVE